jgi:uncharacterized protein (DUF885 family)
MMKPATLVMLSMLPLLATSCGSAPTTAHAPRSGDGAFATGSGDAAFAALTQQILQDTFRRGPTTATYLGIHDYDDQLEDFLPATIAAEVADTRAFAARLDAIDPSSLSQDERLDREFLRHQMDARVLQLDVIRNWERDPDSYSGAITNAAYILMKRNFAPPAERLKLVIAREQKMPALLELARTNLKNPPPVFTQIAIEQIDGNASFFRDDLTLAFKDVTDAALLAQFKASNDAVLAALASYKAWLETDLLPRSQGDFALGEDTYRKLLQATEMVDVPLDHLLAVAENNRRENEAQLVATAKLLDPDKSVDDVLKEVESQHPLPGALLQSTQDVLDSLREFITDKHILTIPTSPPARVQETPPFQRSTTSASMDTPGPFETRATEAYYNMTLPDPRWPEDKQADFMRQWYFAAISNVSVHEVYPGHYLQFLWAKNFPTDVRKVFGANTNIEGWAHYGEQMMLDEGFHADDPRYRLAQLQDALLRNVRFIVGILMHTQGMTVEQAQALFETEGHQPAPVALSEAKRGTNDPLYGYYTMGKLAILKLRSDYKAKLGAAYSLQDFHDTFIKLGPLPMPLIREKMLGKRGELF